MTENEIGLLKLVDEFYDKTTAIVSSSINDDIIEQFGLRGFDLWRQDVESRPICPICGSKTQSENINVAIDNIDDLDAECEDCGAVDEEYLRSVSADVEFITSMDNSYDEEINSILSSTAKGSPITNSMIERIVLSVHDHIDNEDMEYEMNVVKIRILFLGLVSGWLVEEYFDE